MKQFLYLLFILDCTIGYSQQDTITINEHDIFIMYTHKYVGPRIGYSSVPYYVLKEKKDILNGFYKVIIDNNTFYTLHFQNGSKSDWEKDRVIKFYKNNKIYRLDIYLADSVSGLSYYSIDNFNCKEKKAIIYEKDYWEDYIKDTLYAKQWAKGDKINWKFRKLGRLGNFYISKKLCSCP